MATPLFIASPIDEHSKICAEPESEKVSRCPDITAAEA
jgi:hypothetical protein